MKFRQLLLISILFLSACYAKANGTNPSNGEENSKADVMGSVLHHDTKKPLSNVSVTAYTANKKESVAVTDSHGNFSFNDLKPGTYKFVFEKSGYRKVTREKTITRIDEGFELDILLEEQNDYDFRPGPAHLYEF